jgi:hypothetical protein
MSRYFNKQNEFTRHYRRFYAEGRGQTVRMKAPSAGAAARDPGQHFTNSADEFFEYSLHDIYPSDIVGLSIHNEYN